MSSRIKNKRGNKLPGIIFLLSLFLGCSESPEPQSTLESSLLHPGCSELEGGILSCDFKRRLCVGEKVLFDDQTGDIEKSFIDLDQMALVVGKYCIGIEISVLDLPPKLTINHQALEVNRSNYSWDSLIDFDNNQRPSHGDLTIGLTHYKFFDDSEKEVPVSDIALASINVIESDNEAGISTGEAKVFLKAYVIENAFNIYLPKGLHHSLQKIDKSTHIDFVAQFNDGIKSYVDKYPN